MINPDCLQGDDFLNRFLQDYESLRNIGFGHNQAIKMLCTQDYVKDFVQTPEWFVSAKQLPKGYKWADGEKYHVKGTKKSEGETYVFLLAENDLYIKGFFSGAYCMVKDEDEENGYKIFDAPKEYRNKICVIKDWRKYKVQYVLLKLDSDITPFFITSLTDLWHKNGGDISMVEGKILKELKE